MTSRQHMTDYLRGVAALMVCLCHFRHALPQSLDTFVHDAGALGVQVFFVISGFIIPFSLARSNYRLTSFPRFILKRIARLQPPLLAGLALTFVLSHAAIWYKGAGAASFDLRAFLQTALYMRIPSENPVVWTLIVEAKYYLFIGLLHPLLFSRDARVRLGSFALCVLASATALRLIPDLAHLPLFLMGFAACQYKLGLASWREAAALALLAAASAWPGSTGAQIATGLLAAVLVTIQAGPQWKSGLFLGSISYSLYLIHFPVGVKLLNLILPRIGWPWYMLMLPVTLAACIAVAALLWKLAENPSAQWSQKVRLSPRRPAPVIAPQPVPAVAQKE